MRKVTFAVVLVACFVTVAMAVDDRQPATVGEYSGLSQVRNDGVHSAGIVRCANVAGYYYYSGSFDPNSQWANALANEDDTQVPDSHVYQPFSVVPEGKKKHLNVTGLCVNSLDTSGAGIDNPTPYEVRLGAHGGVGGTLVCSGRATSTDGPTGRSGFGINEYTHAVKISKCKLSGELRSPDKSTQYHMNVTPQCFRHRVCSSARFFESTDDSNLNHVGPPTKQQEALWNSTTFGQHFSYAYFEGFYSSFSAGVTGKLVK